MIDIEERKARISEWNRQRYLSDPKKYLARVADWRKRNPDKVRAARKRYQEKNKDKIREYRVKNRERANETARIRVKRWETLNPEKRRVSRRKTAWKANGYPEPTRPMPELCECCRKPPDRNGILNLDHCHVTNKFRGWLCNKCNLGLGYLGDCLGGLRNATKYLERALN